MTADEIRALLATFDDSEACWPWPRCCDNRGYGKVGWGGNGRSTYAHRVVYEVAKGPIPDGLTVDHLCSAKWCINPAHLEAVSMAENVRRGAKNRIVVPVTHCYRGHAYDAVNTYITKEGKRMCRGCLRENMRASRARRKATA